MQGSILVHDLTKAFVRHQSRKRRTLKEVVIRGKRDAGADDCVVALDHVSFEVGPGEMVGIIGRNGAGKSTLLRLIGKVGKPDGGVIEVQGSLGSLLELGAGFHPELTGRENVFVAGVVAGLTREKVQQRLFDIIEFSELEASIDNPLRTYSSGMQLRLAFAISVHTGANVLLIDEVLAVGDLAFQHKCLERIRQLQRGGCAILLVSHDLAQVKRICDRVIWLRDGRIAASGDPKEVSAHYEQAIMPKTMKGESGAPTRQARSDAAHRFGGTRLGTTEMEILDVRLLDAAGGMLDELRSGDSLSVEIVYSPRAGVLKAPEFSVSISDSGGMIYIDANTSNVDMPDIDRNGVARVIFERLDLAGGEYFIDVGAYSADWAHVYDYHWHIYPLLIRDLKPRKGLLSPPHHWELKPDK